MFSETYDVAVQPYNGEFPFFDFISFAMFLGTTPETLVNTLKTKVLYNTFYIDKDTGKLTSKNAGVRLREINAPQEPLKSWQLKLLDVFTMFPAHPANTAFLSGTSILKAAQTAVDGDVLVHVDLKEFFPSHTFVYIKRRLDQLIKTKFGLSLPEDVIQCMTRIVCMNMKLPQGSPCSPMLTIILNYDLDERITETARKYGLEYHRYADDMWFTGTQPDSVVHEFLYDLQDAVHPFVLNYKKTNIMRTRAYPKFKGIRIKLSKAYIPSSQAAKIIKIVKRVFKFEKHVASVSPKSIIVQGVPIPELPIDELKALIAKTNEEIVQKYPSLEGDIICSPIWYYIQSTKKCLGLHILNNKVLYPRKRYNDLRMEAMLLGRQRALYALYFGVLKMLKATGKQLKPKDTAPYIYASLGRPGKKYFRHLLNNPFNRRVFMGKVAYLRQIDPNKADKIMKVEQSAYTKCINGYTDWYKNVNIDFNTGTNWIPDLVNYTTTVPADLEPETLQEILTNTDISPWAL